MPDQGTNSQSMPFSCSASEKSGKAGATTHYAACKADNTDMQTTPATHHQHTSKALDPGEHRGEKRWVITTTHTPNTSPSPRTSSSTPICCKLCTAKHYWSVTSMHVEQHGEMSQPTPKDLPWKQLWIRVVWCASMMAESHAWHHALATLTESLILRLSALRLLHLATGMSWAAMAVIISHAPYQ